eukprot:tig00020660_g12551.t1
MSARLSELPPGAKAALAVASLCGDSVSVPVLRAGLAAGSDEDVLLALKPAVDEGFLVLADPERQTYRFAHDRIQQAAAELADFAAESSEAGSGDSSEGSERNPRRRSLSRRVGWRLFDATREDPAQRESLLFPLVGMLNAGTEEAADRLSEARRGEAAALNLAAAQRAKQCVAHEKVAEYARCGLEALGAGAWDGPHAETAFELSLLACESAAMRHDAAAAAAAFEEVLAKAGTRPQRIRAYRLRVGLLEAMQANSVEAIAALPMCQDPELSGQIEVMMDIVLPAFYGYANAPFPPPSPFHPTPTHPSYPSPPPPPSPPLPLPGNLRFYAFVTARTVNLALAHGLTPPIPMALSILGTALALPVSGLRYDRSRPNYEEEVANAPFLRIAGELGQVAVRMARSFGIPPIIGISMFYGAITANFATTMSDVVAMFVEDFELLSGLGLHGAAGAVSSLSVLAALVRGEPLPAVAQRAHRSLAWQLMESLKTKNRIMEGMVRGLLYTTLELQGARPQAGFDVEAHEAGLQHAPPWFQAMFYGPALLMRFVLGRLDEAVASMRRLGPFEEASAGVCLTHEEFCFGAGLLCAELARPTSVSHLSLSSSEPLMDPAEARRRFEGYRAAFVGLAKVSPRHLAIKHLLLEAEAARIGGEPLAAARGYARAAALAARNDFPYLQVRPPTPPPPSPPGPPL